MNRSIFLKKKTNQNNIKSMNLNFGPNHPAAHGVLRIILRVNNEVIEQSDCHIGLLHRGTEKLIESKPYILSIPYFDRLDYVSMLVQEHAYCLAIEKLLEKNKFFQSYSNLRVLYDELTRILNHLMAIGSHTIDIGAMAPIFWAFEEREKIMEFYERVSGARMHAAFYRPNKSNLSGLSIKLLNDILLFSNNSIITINEIHNIIIYNKIWKKRMVNIGVLDYNLSKNYGLTGVMLRSVGIKYDIRLNVGDTYASYYYLNFKSYNGINGDSYDRYLIRINEIIESLFLVNQVVSHFLKHNFKNHKFLKNYFLKKWKKNPYKNMESMIQHFKYWSEGFKVKKNKIYVPVESPKGEFAVILISDGTNIPFRCKIRSPAYYNLNFLNKNIKGMMLADLITLIGSVDVVFGEVDR